MIADCHVHVMMYQDPLSLIRQAADHGICLVGVSCTAQEAERAEAFIAEPNFYPMAGIHPWYAKSSRFDEKRFERIVSKGFCGFGELGLDPDGTELSLLEQESLLERELDFACAHHLPLSLHIRKAHGELVRILKKFAPRLSGGVVHNFTFSCEIARSYLDLGLCLSVGGHILKKAPRLIKSLHYAGADKVVLETDADFLHSGPYDFTALPRQLQTYCEIFGLNEQEAVSRLWRNFQGIVRSGVNK